MPRFYLYRSGTEWGFFQTINEDVVEQFARSIRREDAPGLEQSEIVEEIIVMRFAPSHVLDGQISRMEWGEVTGRYWVAQRERTDRERARFAAAVAGWSSPPS
jgi:hypothetical protein